jgi:chromosomal replication initiator protein
VPRDIRGLEERLLHRFESGLIAEISAPELETRVAILQKKAKSESLTLVATYVAQSARSNVRKLQGCLNCLAAHVAISGVPITHGVCASCFT